MAELNHPNKKNLFEGNEGQQAPEKNRPGKEKKLGNKREKFSPGEHPDYNAEDFSTD